MATEAVALRPASAKVPPAPRTTECRVARTSLTGDVGSSTTLPVVVTNAATANRTPIGLAHTPEVPAPGSAPGPAGRVGPRAAPVACESIVRVARYGR